ncbi:MAG: hypothetical protein U9Q22_06745, partial [Candidatus Altiarchaeota archaeon]|nr:hypothetical protein [Candidatus Altiarchaeota archaeon]
NVEGIEAKQKDQEKILAEERKKLEEELSEIKREQKDQEKILASERRKLEGKLGEVEQRGRELSQAEIRFEEEQKKLAAYKAKRGDVLKKWELEQKKGWKDQVVSRGRERKELDAQRAELKDRIKDVERDRLKIEEGLRSVDQKRASVEETEEKQKDQEKIIAEERKEIEGQRKRLKEELSEIEKRGSELSQAEIRFEEEQKKKLAEYKAKKEEGWKKWELEQKKRWKDQVISRERERKELDVQKREIRERIRGIERDRWMVEEDLRLIEKKRDDIREIGKRQKLDKEKIDKEKKKMEKERREIQDKLREIEEMGKKSAEEKARIREERDRLEKEIKKIEDEWVDIVRADKSITGEGKTKEGKRLHQALKRIEREWGKIEPQAGGEKKVRMELTKTEDDLTRLKGEHLKKNESQEIKVKNLVNSLLRLVNERNEIRLGDAAQELNIDKQALDRYSRILEDEEIIGIKHPLVGDPILRKESN